MGNKSENKLKENILKKLRKEISDSFGNFFFYAWDEKLSQMLEKESRYAKLVDWINNEIDNKIGLSNLFSPATMEKVANYSSNFFNTFKDNIGDVAILIYFRELLLDDRSSTKIRRNIEYAIEKLFDVHYSEYLKSYV